MAWRNYIRGATRSYEISWRNYIRGNVVSDNSVRIITNFLTLLAGTGQLEHDDDGVKNGKLTRQQLGDPGKRLNVDEVRSLLQSNISKSKCGEVQKNDIAKRVDDAMSLVQKLLQDNGSNQPSVITTKMHASNFHRTMFEKQHTKTAKVEAETRGKACIEIYKRNWLGAYNKWKKRLTEARDEQGNSIAPYKAQWELMDAIHKRCVEEAKE